MGTGALVPIVALARLRKKERKKDKELYGVFGDVRKEMDPMIEFRIKCQNQIY